MEVSAVPEAAKRRRPAPAPSAPDLIPMAEAEQLTGCSHQTLYRMTKRGEITLRKVQGVDSLDRRSSRPALSRSELLSLFVPRPRPGEPIQLPDGESYYLREDATRRFGCSNIVLGYWTKQPSRRRSRGPALLTRKFYIIGGPGRGRPKKLTAWRGKDLQDITDGLEGKHPERGKGPWAKRQRQAQQDAVKAFLGDLEKRLPLWASDALDQARHARVSRFLFYRTKKKQGIRTSQADTETGPRYYWHLPGQGAPGLTSVVPQPEESSAPSRPRGRGRPKGKTQDWLRRAKEMLEAWDRGDFAGNKAAAGRAHAFNRSDATKIINAHEAGKRRKQFPAATPCQD